MRSKRPTPQFPQVGKRLRRANGHLAAIVGMLDQGRSCVELAQQLHAVEKAIGNAKKELIKDHIRHCMSDSSATLPREAGELIREFQDVTKYL